MEEAKWRGETAAEVSGSGVRKAFEVVIFEQGAEGEMEQTCRPCSEKV